MEFANDYLRKWGVDLMPIYSKGTRNDPPAIPPRIAYALRRIGGPSGLNQVTQENRPFVFKDFCEAYNLAPIADSHAPQLAEKFPITEGKVKQLTDGLIAEQLPAIRTEAVPIARPKTKPFEPLTAEQRAERYAMLRQQAQSLQPVRRTAGNETQSLESGSLRQSQESARA